LRQQLDTVAATRDPVADLSMLGLAYFSSATAGPNLYRAMFLDGPVDETDVATGLDTFMRLVDGVARCMDAGRLPNAEPSDPAELAVELWALNHGFVTLRLAHLLTEEQALERLESSARSMFIAWGDSPAAYRRSTANVRRRLNMANQTENA
jgi:hypothetical protein